jgi:enterochelin esterase-like enzyme
MASLLIQSALLAQAVAPAAGAATGDPSLARCAHERAPIEQPCTLPLTVSPTAAAELLRNTEQAWWLQSDKLTLIARPEPDSIGILCCTIQTIVEPLGDSGLVGVTVRVPRVEEALIDVVFPKRRGSRPAAVVRGHRAPPAPEEAAPLRGTITFSEIESAILGERRGVFIYTPPGVPSGARLPVIYLADATTQHFAPILEAAVASGRARPAMIVGLVPPSGSASGCIEGVACTLRNLEYQSGASVAGSGLESPFGRHLRYVAEELIPFVERNHPASPNRRDRVVAGMSSGGAWAVSAAARMPDLFGGILSLSSSGRSSVADAAQLRGVRLYAGGGTFEPEYLGYTRERAALARRAGSDVRFREIVSGHSQIMWKAMFAEGVPWLLSRAGEHAAER